MAGSVVAVQVRESAGALALYSVLRAVETWRFSPGSTVEGLPACCRASLHVRFSRD